MNKYAFPTEPRGPIHADHYDGLTKREYAAIHIAAAIAGRKTVVNYEHDAFEAVALADAVLREAGE